MKNYLDLLNEILLHGTDKPNRTGISTRALFTRLLSWNLGAGFPMVTTKKLSIKNIAAELLWFLSGSSDISLLQAMDCHIWDANVAAWEGGTDAGRIYGVQWRDWQTPNGGTVDQVANLVHKLRNNPNDRRMIVQAYNPGELDQMCLPPCHMMFQCYVADGRLNLTMYQRSCDTFLGVPYNIASYALLTHMLACVTNHKVGTLNIVFGDVHIYENHFEQVKLQLSRHTYPLPRLALEPRKELSEFLLDDIRLVGYTSHPAIKAEMAV